MTDLEKLARFNEYLSDESSIEDLSMHWQPLFRFNRHLNWLFSLEDLLFLIDKILTKFLDGYSSLRERAQAQVINDFESQEIMDSLYFEDVLNMDEEYDKAYLITIDKILENLDKFDYLQKCFVLLFVFNSLKLRIDYYDEKNHNYTEYYKTRMLFFEEDLKKYLKGLPYKTLEQFLKFEEFSIDIELLQSDPATLPSLNQINFIFVLYSFLYINDIKIIYSKRGKENEYDILTDLGNYLQSNNSDLDHSKLEFYLTKFENSPPICHPIAVKLKDYFSGINLVSITKGNAKKHLSTGFGFDLSVSFNSGVNLAKLKSRLKGFDSLFDQIKELNIKVINFFPRSQNK